MKNYERRTFWLALPAVVAGIVVGLAPSRR